MEINEHARVPVPKQCNCICHKPGYKVMHCIPCCDQSETELDMNVEAPE